MAATKSLTNTGRNALRDALQADLDDMAIGTDGSEPSTTDTALGAKILEKAFDGEADDGPGALFTSMRVLSSEANGSTIRELGLKSGTDLYARVVFAGIDKTQDFEIDFEVTATVKNP